tara:strand:+ start:250 stop:450 length:201 start_codon:yes stop_codon:yes gene_type:complete
MTDDDIKSELSEIRQDIHIIQQKYQNMITAIGRLQDDVKKLKGQLDALQYHQHDENGIQYDTRYVK